MRVHRLMYTRARATSACTHLQTTCYTRVVVAAARAARLSQAQPCVHHLRFNRNHRSCTWPQIQIDDLCCPKSGLFSWLHARCVRHRHYVAAYIHTHTVVPSRASCFHQGRLPVCLCQLLKGDCGVVNVCVMFACAVVDAAEPASCIIMLLSCFITMAPCHANESGTSQHQKQRYDVVTRVASLPK
jgi:hypothetical protein